MENKSSHIRTSQIVMRQHDKQFRAVTYVCQIARRIKNATNYLIRHEKKPNGKPLSHSDADKWLKQNNIELYTKLPAAFAQRMTQIVGSEWKSFYEAHKGFAKQPVRYKAKTKPPRYANKATTTYIGRNGFKVENGTLFFANNIIPPIKTQFSFSQNWNAKIIDTIVREVRLVPKGNCFVIEIIYDESKAEKEGGFCLLLDKSRKAGIDLGINNLIAIATDQQGVRPALINGKALKSINASYNKRVAKLRSQGKYSHIQAVTNRRHRRIKDLLHRASNKVIDYCVENDIGTLVIGHNKNWKQDINIGKVNNQKFVNIPHSILISQIQYKCYKSGIEAIIQEESYTSKASALDNDHLPIYGEESNNVSPLFSGKRTRRGLYKGKNGILNADVNGSLNILRKATGNALSLACKGYVSNPITIELIPKSVVIRRENVTHKQAA
jgi:IS605 OrfB family transposase